MKKKIKTKKGKIKVSRSYKKKKNLTKKEYHLKFLKDHLEQRKRVYEVYIKALVKYKMPETAYSAIMADELYHDTLMRRMKNAKPGEFMTLMFGDRKKLTEEEKIEADTKYYDRLIKLVENRIEMSIDEIKTKIAEDSITKMDAWLRLPEFSNSNKEVKDAN